MSLSYGGMPVTAWLTGLIVKRLFICVAVGRVGLAFTKLPLFARGNYVAEAVLGTQLLAIVVFL